MTPQEKFAELNKAKAEYIAPDWFMSLLSFHPSLIDIVLDAPEDDPIWDDLRLRMAKALAVASLGPLEKAKYYVPMIEGTKVLAAINVLCVAIYEAELKDSRYSRTPDCEEGRQMLLYGDAFAVLRHFTNPKTFAHIPARHVAQMITILKAQNEGE